VVRAEPGTVLHRDDGDNGGENVRGAVAGKASGNSLR
jgi:hypothetical protein